MLDTESKKVEFGKKTLENLVFREKFVLSTFRFLINLTNEEVSSKKFNILLDNEYDDDIPKITTVVDVSWLSRTRQDSKVIDFYGKILQKRFFIAIGE